MTGLRTAIGLLTVLPAGPATWEPARSVWWFPVVALGLAGLVGGVAAGAHAAFPPLLAAALAVAVWAVLTGGLHLDGLADTADAAFAPVEGERRLAILADVHHGTFAVVAVVLILMLKVSALASLDRAGGTAAAVTAIVAARGVLPLVIHAFPAARPAGMGAATRAGATPLAVALGLLAAAIAGTAALGMPGLGLVVGLVAVALVVGAWLAWRFGGLNGDTYGAIVELAEAAALTAAAGLLANGHASAFPFGGRL